MVVVTCCGAGYISFGKEAGMRATPSDNRMRFTNEMPAVIMTRPMHIAMGG